MKFKTILFAAIFALSIASAQADENKRTLTFRDALGRTLFMPVMNEEAEEEIPFDHIAVFKEIRQLDVNRPIDISEMIKPEPDADDIPSQLKALIAKDL